MKKSRKKPYFSTKKKKKTKSALLLYLDKKGKCFDLEFSLF